MAKKEKSLLPKVEELEEISVSITAKFSILEIKMKGDMRWKIKMLIHEILPKSYHDYSIKLEFDDRPLLKTIEQLEKDASMFTSEDKKSLKEVDKKIAEAYKELKQLKSECTDIDFVTQSEEIKYKDGDTALLFKVLDIVIQPINEKKYRLSDYRAVLTPIIK